ncbi:MAG: molybdenum cofactor guanylyltransferase [Deltaproteobacteria bacterium]|nr:molybdenum cofactor guanylyltransferase [Deltaproteobacteria bacterium]
MGGIHSASAIILAGGQSRRMGTPKATLKFGNSTILERVLVELGGDFDDILVVAAPASSEPFSIEHLLGTLPSVRLLRDESAYEGAAIALSRGLVAAVNDIAFACSCDLPLMRVEVVRALYAMLNGYDAVLPVIEGRPQPLFAFYRRDTAALIELQLALGERRLTSITGALTAYRPENGELRQFDPDLRSFLNINTWEDYLRARAIYDSLGAKHS